MQVSEICSRNSPFSPSSFVGAATSGFPLLGKARSLARPAAGNHPQVSTCALSQASTSGRPTTAFQQVKDWGRSSSGSQSSSCSRSSSSKGTKKGGGGGGQNNGDDEEEETWGILDWSRFQGWDVPWSGASVAGGMALWFGSFVAVGFLVVPGLYGAAGAGTCMQLFALFQWSASFTD